MGDKGGLARCGGLVAFRLPVKLAGWRALGVRAASQGCAGVTGAYRTLGPGVFLHLLGGCFQDDQVVSEGVEVVLDTQAVQVGAQPEHVAGVLVDVRVGVGVAVLLSE